MLRLLPAASFRLASDVAEVCERFLDTLGPRWPQHLAEVVLVDASLRRSSGGDRLRLLLVTDERSAGTRALLGLAVEAVCGRSERDDLPALEVDLVSRSDWAAQAEAASTLVRAARRTGLTLWRAAAG